MTNNTNQEAQNDLKKIIAQKDTPKREFKDKLKLDIYNLVIIGCFVYSLYNTKARYIIFSILVAMNVFGIIVTLKAKMYKTKKEKLNLGFVSFVLITMILGLIFNEFAYYAAVICIVVQVFAFFQNVYLQHFAKQ